MKSISKIIFIISISCFSLFFAANAWCGKTRGNSRAEPAQVTGDTITADSFEATMRDAIRKLKFDDVNTTYKLALSLNLVNANIFILRIIAGVKTGEFAEMPEVLNEILRRAETNPNLLNCHTINFYMNAAIKASEHEEVRRAFRIAIAKRHRLLNWRVVLSYGTFLLRPVDDGGYKRTYGTIDELTIFVELGQIALQNDSIPDEDRYTLNLFVDEASRMIAESAAHNAMALPILTELASHALVLFKTGYPPDRMPAADATDGSAAAGGHSTQFGDDNEFPGGGAIHK